MSGRTDPIDGTGDDTGGDTSQARTRRRDRLLAWGFTAGLHLAVLVALLWSRHTPPPAKPSPSLLMVSVAEQPKPSGPPTQTDPGGRDSEVQPTVPQIVMPVWSTAAAADNSDLLSESQLAGAAGVGDGGGGGGGGCDMARAVQQALRHDPLVHNAVAGANRLGKAVMMWNGDWVRSGAQDGKGLSAVREAIMWAVAFAPATCRDQPMHGLVVVSLADGSTRFAIGSGDWRWTDLLGVHRNSPVR